HPIEKVIVITKIRFAEEIRSSEEILAPEDVKVNKKELDMGLALVNQYSSKFDINQFKDEYRYELLKIIEAKAKGVRPTIKKLKPQKASEDNLYEQLMQSLSSKKGA